MWFKNLHIYRLTQDFELSPEQLSDQLAETPSRECGPHELSTLGWYPPLGRDAALLTHATGGCIMICAKLVEKVIPSAVVRDRLAEKVAAIELEEDRKVRRREQLEIKDELMHDLLPRAFSKSNQTYAYIDTQSNYMLVDSSSAKKADELISLLRETLGTFPVRPLEVATAPSSVMTQWLESQAHLPGLDLQDECELFSPEEEGAVVRCRRQDLVGEEIDAHLKAGKLVAKLALAWGDRLAFVLADDLSIKRLKFLDVIQNEAADTVVEDAASRFDADFALMSLELRGLVEKLVEAFGGIAAEA